MIPFNNWSWFSYLGYKNYVSKLLIEFKEALLNSTFSKYCDIFTPQTS